MDYELKTFPVWNQGWRPMKFFIQSLRPKPEYFDRSSVSDFETETKERDFFRF